MRREIQHRWASWTGEVRRWWASWTGKTIDVHVYGGLLLVGIGLYQAHPAAAFAVPGAFLVFMGYWRG